MFWFGFLLGVVVGICLFPFAVLVLQLWPKSKKSEWLSFLICLVVVFMYCFGAFFRVSGLGLLGGAGVW